MKIYFRFHVTNVIFCVMSMHYLVTCRIGYNANIRWKNTKASIYYTKCIFILRDSTFTFLKKKGGEGVLSNQNFKFCIRKENQIISYLYMKTSVFFNPSPIFFFWTPQRQIIIFCVHLLGQIISLFHLKNWPQKN